MPLQRLPDWPARLGALVAARLATPFAWGPNDCASFAADAYQAMTGRDCLQELRGTRLNERQARRQIRAGGGIPAALLRAGLVPVAPALVQRGDLVMMPQGRQRVLAVCLGADVVAPAALGLECASAATAVQAWRLGGDHA